MIIALKDKLLPLMAVASKQSNHVKKQKPKTTKLKRNNKKQTGSKTNVWPSPRSPSMQYIKEEEDESPKRERDTVHWNIKIETSPPPKSNKRRKKKKKAIHPNLSSIYWSGNTASLYMHRKCF